MRAWYHLAIVIISTALLMSCGGGGSTIPATVQNQGKTPTAPFSATAETPTPTVRLTVKTNYYFANQHFIIAQIGNEEWERPPLALVNGGVEFFLDLPIGARYNIGLQETAGLDPPVDKDIDLRNPIVSELEETLKYSLIPGDSDQI